MRTTWGRDHAKWTGSQSLPGASQEVLRYYLDAIAEQQGGADDSLDQPKRLV